MFSQTVEYALRAMVQLAAEAPQASTTRKIAEKSKVPGAYLAKVLQSMRRAGLLHSRRGVGGGVSLSRPPHQINLLEVIDAIEPLERAAGSASRARSKSALSPLARTLDEALEQVRSTFARVSLADMTPGRRKKAAPSRRGAKRRSQRKSR